MRGRRHAAQDRSRVRRGNKLEAFDSHLSDSLRTLRKKNVLNTARTPSNTLSATKKHAKHRKVTAQVRDAVRLSLRGGADGLPRVLAAEALHHFRLLPQRFACGFFENAARSVGPREVSRTGTVPKYFARIRSEHYFALYQPE